MPRSSVLLAVLSFCIILPGQTAEHSRVAALGQVWGTLKYFHPYLAYRDIDWDQALARAIPKVRAAKTREEFAAGIQTLLDALQDPVTHVQGRPRSGRSGTSGSQPLLQMLPDGVLIVTVNNYQDLRGGAEWNRKADLLNVEIGKSNAVIFDLRSSAGREESDPEMVAGRFRGALLQNRETLIGPGQRVRQYAGFPNGSASGIYHSGFYVRDGDVNAGRPAAVERPIVFIVNAGTQLSGAAAALRAAGKARIVMEGAASDRCLVETRVIDIGEGMTVRFRIGELVWPDGTTGFEPDEIAFGSAAVDAAVRMARGDWPPARLRSTTRLPVSTAHAVERRYPADPFPSLENRLLAAFQIWAAVEYFYPHKNLMTKDWGAVLRESVGSMERAGSAGDYADTVSRMLAALNDSHAVARGAVIGPYWALVRLRLVEGLPVVADVIDEASGLQRGDIVESVDGVPVAERIAQIESLNSASNRGAMDIRIAAQLLTSREERPALLSVRGSDGVSRRVTVVRKKDGYRQWRNRQNGPAVAVLPGGIGYADLNRIARDRVGTMFDELKNTRAIIFDRRSGDLLGPAVSQRLLAGESAVSEIDRTPIVSLLDAEKISDRAGGFLQVTDRLHRSDEPGYRGKVVILNDSYAQSRDEHGALGFIAAGATFVGSPTAGALMTIGLFPIPGGLEPRFSAGDVRWPDGRPVQGVGVTPHVLAVPTIQGIREGRDEVLEKALKYLGAPVPAEGIKGIGEAIR